MAANPPREQHGTIIARPRIDTAELVARLERAMRGFRLQSAHNLLDEALAAWPADVVAREIAVPLLDRLEHGGDMGAHRFASSLLELRLLAQARGWEAIDGPLALLACAPRETRVVGLIGTGLALAAAHWRISYLGAATPIAALRGQPAAIVVLSAERADLSQRERDELRALAPPVFATGAARIELAHAIGARTLPADLRTLREQSSHGEDDSSPAPA